MLQTLHHMASLYHSASHLSHSFRDAHDEMIISSFHRATETAEFLRLRLPSRLANPKIAIVCGSGLGELAETVSGEQEAWDYKDVPNFPIGTVAGHEGKLIFGTMGDRETPVMLLVGRAHFYEGNSMDVVTFATRVCKVLGVETMILTNAAGGLNPDYEVGDVVCLNDHINLAGLSGFNPLRGPNEDELGLRFLPLSDAYDIFLRRLAHDSWTDLRRHSPSRRKLHEGVYAYVAGPTYETRAECRVLRQLGADVVGMSTVPEIIVARHAGMRILAFSLVTNKAVLEPVLRADDPQIRDMSRDDLDRLLAQGKADHEEVLEAGKLAALDMQDLILRIVSQL